MRTLIISIGLLSAVCACDSSSPDVTGPAPRTSVLSSTSVHSLTGSGKLDLSEFDPALKAETYAFSVFKAADGAVTGEIEIHLRDPAVAFHADATCLAVDSNNAWVGGVITHTSDPDTAPEGRTFWVRVQDNGQGRDNADRISFVRLGVPAVNCNFKRPASLPFAFSGGNLVVR